MQSGGNVAPTGLSIPVAEGTLPSYDCVGATRARGPTLNKAYLHILHVRGADDCPTSDS